MSWIIEGRGVWELRHMPASKPYLVLKFLWSSRKRDLIKWARDVGLTGVAYETERAGPARGICIEQVWHCKVQRASAPAAVICFFGKKRPDAGEIAHECMHAVHAAARHWTRARQHGALKVFHRKTKPGRDCRRAGDWIEEHHASALQSCVDIADRVYRGMKAKRGRR